MMSEMHYLPTCSGIYFAIEESGQVAYIGQNTNIYKRWRAHHVQGDLCDLGDLQSARSVRIAWLELSREKLDEVEVALIRRFRPRLNSSHNPVERAVPLPVVHSKKESVGMLTVKEAAELTGAAENSIRVWVNNEEEKQKRFPNAQRVDSPRGPYWLIPESDLIGYTNPGRGRPPKPKKEKASKKIGSKK